MGQGSSKVDAPIAPGMFETLRIGQVNAISFNDVIRFEGPCVLAFDGEREREIQAGQQVSMRVSRSGPSVLDIAKTIELAVCRNWFKH